MSYTIDEIIIEKYRALLTRAAFMERDLFDLYLIPNSLKVKIKEVAEKIKSASLIKKELKKIVSEKLRQLKDSKFFNSQERLSDLAIVKYDLEDFDRFKERIKPILIEICDVFLRQNN